MADEVRIKLTVPEHGGYWAITSVTHGQYEWSAGGGGKTPLAAIENTFRQAKHLAARDAKKGRRPNGYWAARHLVRG